ncbi:hypothetical protein Kpol_2000p42 [Vanderwaltozyma polyspora DSM 70294]|uniref:Folic acid synthesis protein FOL1 n=1 Tax=Vanderwaltozyma polyspora (strain ATCC 22028 / DSM 70294 / BCRC 21397 / CBS 2163 / NBRC 10782 / NRRL Y-8283 / UCD 57-17) TaxID=436907 RepID=A7TF52_VANPO|nr:uncharacterized protein Kpol_2000p42 [Vanderwaltozyma polyspora DSM 70294]EDO19077.1 hypothetical protein Kpol_2000p42 [Vanderwaltozyma polyspora DSM 70294]
MTKDQNLKMLERRFMNMGISRFYSTSNNVAVVKNVKDKVYIEKLRVDAIVGPDCWGQLNPQRCLITLGMSTDFGKASNTDDLSYSLNYAAISRDVTNFVNARKNWLSLSKLSRDVSDFAMKSYKGIDMLELNVNSKDAHIRSEDVSCVVLKSRNEDSISEPKYDYLRITNLKLLTLIGIFTFERLQKQFVTLDLIIPWPKDVKDTVSYKTIIDKVVAYTENANFKTVEALVESVAKVIAMEPYFQQLQDVPIEVKVIKLNAITATEGVGVSCIRTPKELQSLHIETDQGKRNGVIEADNISSPFNLPVLERKISKINSAFLAFGSNVGDRFANINNALSLLQQNEKVNIEKVSSLFESEPMYFKDQSPFMNGCIEITTQLTPHELLELCKKIEYDELKRIKHFDNGPRSIDLDIVMYINDKGEHILINDETLVVPHPRMLERTFVLEPLCELISPTHIHPISAEPIFSSLQEIYKKQDPENELWVLNPLPGQSRFLKYKSVTKFNCFDNSYNRSLVSPTYLMAIINTTPDSFSGDGMLDNDIDMQLKHIKELCDKALQLSDSIILDIGGCSTRPNSAQASNEEEFERTIPLIKAIRESNTLPNSKIILSIDTYRASMAQKAIEAGVDIINDISGGSFDKDMFKVIAKNARVSYVLSHIRGDISNMVTLNDYTEDKSENEEFIYGEKSTSSETSFIRTISRELAKSYEKAISEGIKRWQILLDPGLGFAKNGKQNLAIIKNLPIMKNYSVDLNDDTYVSFRNLPVLLGPSRKKFIGTITKDDEPKDRDFATGALVASCIGNDTNIVRVHNAIECGKSVKIADTLYRDIE